MATLPPVFVGIFTQSEATAAQRTFSFLAVDATDGITPETTLDYEDSAADVQVSKNGGAFANATGVVTEVAVGVYQYVAATAELDTIGTVLWKFVDAAARTVLAQAQVNLLDLNVATVNPGAGGITATTLAADAITAAKVAADVATEINDAIVAGAVGTQTAAVVAQTTPTKVTGPHAMGTRTTDGSFTPLSMIHAIDADITIAGTWNGATVTVEVCADVNAVSPVWSTYDDGAGPNPLTANGTVRVTGPYSGVRATLSNDGASTSLVASCTMRSPA